MEEQTSWKAHTFTLMIFGGIVVLCSIFFVLGMLVGRTQNVKIGTVATAEAAIKPQPKEAFEAAPIKQAARPPQPAASVPRVEDERPASPSPPVAINLQIAALKKQSDAEKQVDDLKQKGFRAFMLTPSADDPNPFYRVQVGASDPVEAESLRLKLEAAGYKPILKK